MTDPLNSSTSDRDAFAPDGGLNASDTQDWTHRKQMASTTRVFGVFAASLVALMVIFAGVMYWKLYMDKPSVATAQPVVSARLDKDAQIAQLQEQIARLQSQPAPAPTTGAPVAGTLTPAAPVYSPDPTAIAQLSARIDRLEANQRILARAAAAASAASELQQKARTSDPFINELAAVEPAFDDPTLTAPLRAVAEKGVPSEVQLALEFPQAAARANIAAKADSDEDSLFNRAKHALGSFISVRRTDNLNGRGPEATLLRAETRLNHGDLDGALKVLATLPASAQKALKPWLDKAHARSLVDATTHRITVLALNRLVQANDGVQAAPGGAQ